MKKITKLMCGILSLGLLVTGCATVGNIKNENSEIIYNGNSAVMVDGYLYYANSFVDVSTNITSDKQYKQQATMGYLARLNTNIALSAKNKDYSPKNVETVAGEVVGQTNSFMFVLGKYIYYATPNRQEFSNADGKPEKKYSYTTLYRSELNGNHQTKIYTTKGDVSQIEVLKYDNQYYIVIYAGTDLVRVNIGNVDKAKADIKVLAENVQSVAMPKTYQQNKLGSTLDWNGQIYFTTAKTNENSADVSGTNIERIKINEDEAQVMDAVSTTFTFIGRENDVVFFTNNVTGGDTYTYIADLTGDDSQYAITRNKKKEFYAGSISNIYALNTIISKEVENSGYIFMMSNNLYLAKEQNGKFIAEAIKFTDGTNEITTYQILDVNGKTIYLSTTTGIYKGTISGAGTIICQTLTKMTAIYDGQLCAFDNNYVYFFAKLEEVELEEGEEPETDDKYYMYRANINKTYTEDAKNYELIGKTTIVSRQSK